MSLLIIREAFKVVNRVTGLLVGGVVRLTWCGRLARLELCRKFGKVGAAVWRSIVWVFIFRVRVVGIL